jgi:hypothetical protein
VSLLPQESDGRQYVAITPGSGINLLAPKTCVGQEAGTGGMCMVPLLGGAQGVEGDATSNSSVAGNSTTTGGRRLLGTSETLGLKFEVGTYHSHLCTARSLSLSLSLPPTHAVYHVRVCCCCGAANCTRWQLGSMFRVNHPSSALAVLPSPHWPPAEPTMLCPARA